MTIYSESRELLTTALLNLDPRINDKRIALYSILVEVSLFNLKQSSDIEQITTEINSITNQKDFLNYSDFQHSLEDCIKRGTVLPNGEKYELSKPRNDSFIRAFSEAENNRKVVEQKLKEHIQMEILDSLSDEILTEIVAAVERTLTENVYENSINLARNNLTFEELVESIENSEPDEMIENTISQIFPSDRVLLKKQIIGGINEYFKKMPTELKQFLQLLNSNVLLNQILSIDPSIVHRQLIWFSHRRLYLDTNVVIAFFFEAQKCHEITLEVLQVSKRIGVQLFISPATLVELQSQVLRAKKDYLLVDKQKISRAFASVNDDAILSTYFLLKNRQPSIEWIGFISQFDDLEEFLFQNDILVEKSGMNEAGINPIIPEIKKAITDSKILFTSPNVIEHDVINYSLILTQRTSYPPDERGQLIWLLTLDNSLKKAQIKLKSANLVNIPYCMQVSEWGEIVLPIQSLLGFQFNDFLGYLAQAKLGIISNPNIVQLDFFETITDSNIDIDRLQTLEPNQICNVLIKLQEDHEAKSILASIQKSQNQDEIDKLKTRFNSKIDQATLETDPINLLKAEYEQKIQFLTRTIEAKDQSISNLERSIYELRGSWWNRLITLIKKLFKKGNFGQE